jgi:hypothetical protein
MRIAVIDGQGGGIGRVITEKLAKELRRLYPRDVEILALGTNALATSAMLKAGANEGASGESAIIFNAGRVDLILGSISMMFANSMLGEVSLRMAEAIAGSRAKKILLPLNRANVSIVGYDGEPLPHLVDEMVALAREYVKQAILKEMKKNKSSD